MPEHRISLQRAWETPAGRIDLPTPWGDHPIPKQLRRNFHRPTSDPATESVYLVVEDVPGLRAVSLNGEDLGLVAGAGVRWEVLIQNRMRSSNLLVLDLDPAKIPPGVEWGRIALLIQS